MARSIRIEYEGAIYHVMARGNRREDIYLDDEDRDAVGNLLKTTSPGETVAAAGRETSYEYDIFGRTTKITEPGNRISTTLYNAFGEIWKVTDAKGQTVQTVRDGAGRVLKTIERDSDAHGATPERIATRITETTFDTLARVSPSAGQPSTWLGKVASVSLRGEAGETSDVEVIPVTDSSVLDSFGRALSATRVMGERGSVCIKH